MSNPKSKTAAELKADAVAKAAKQSEDAKALADAEFEKLTPEEKEAFLAAQSEPEDKVEDAEEADYICPLSINYVELEKILDGEALEDYVGGRLPEEEVKRIKTDYEIYLKNK